MWTHWRHCITAAVLAMTAMVSSASDIVYEYEDDPVYGDSIPRLNDLRSDAHQAAQQGVPIVLEFSTVWCEYCLALEQQVLQPMLNGKEYDDRMLLRKVVVDDNESFRDQDGRLITTTRLAHRYDVELYPTLVFIDARGRQVSEAIVGITVLDYTAEQIDQALANARRTISSAGEE